ncbi:uncharacterized protein F5147DRAFT_763518 [Suillus discolor]|uniref:Uncharacterized protein n=1 Tax=Suillus discolor TaxID=1912936 RepID=A0A9P7JPP7_9AGAM|nr:uncharacterized protein F5147DRAFT_763518 [Suillus discolor]KAG2096484.1 hypothetical protein F5147DRAFT_763518 [Suillus discolor]
MVDITLFAGGLTPAFPAFTWLYDGFKTRLVEPELWRSFLGSSCDATLCFSIPQACHSSEVKRNRLDFGSEQDGDVDEGDRAEELEALRLVRLAVDTDEVSGGTERQKDELLRSTFANGFKSFHIPIVDMTTGIGSLRTRMHYTKPDLRARKFDKIKSWLNLKIPAIRVLRDELSKPPGMGCLPMQSRDLAGLLKIRMDHETERAKKGI